MTPELLQGDVTLLLMHCACAQCKHQLAARLAQALHRSHNITVSDEVLAELLLST